MSCFGSEVGINVLVHVNNVCGNTDIIAGLDWAVKELLIKKKADRTFSFVHDLIQSTVYSVR